MFQILMSLGCNSSRNAMSRSLLPGMDGVKTEEKPWVIPGKAPGKRPSVGSNPKNQNSATMVILRYLVFGM